MTTKVTLITGDEITVINGKVLPRGGKGREGIGFRSFNDPQGDLHVVPIDAQRKLGPGGLDERLFDVSLLARSHYDDASSKTIPLIVQGQGIGAATAEPLSSINAHAVKAGKDGSFWTGARIAGTGKVWLDGKVTAALDRSAAQVGAPEAWQKGFTGKDVTVAVLDTGVDETHPDLAGTVVESKNFGNSDSTDDRFGHGTHVASIIASHDAKYKGIAPDAKIINGKVLNDAGAGQESDLIAGMEWAASKAKVINMSLGAPPTDGTDPLSQALNAITQQTGALFVVAAGNSGSANSTVGTPGSADAALTVGAVNRDDTLASFSSRGPRQGDNAIKPDITAPGVGIAAAKAKNGTIGTPVDATHVAMSGTSMATPHVAGAAAILAAKNPQWKAEDIKAALMNTAKPNPSLSVYEQGAGRLDVNHAVSTGVSTVPGSLSFGTTLWPHNDDKPLTKTLTYHNTGTTDVTLDLSVTDVKPAAPGMFTVTPAKLTVPAGGTANATVTTDTRVSAPDGTYGAMVTASDGTHIPIGVVKEAESYDVRVTILDHNGKPAPYPNSTYRLVDVAKPLSYYTYDPSGSVIERLPKGTYYLDGLIYTDNPDPTTGYKTTWLSEPTIVVNGPSELVFDARDGIQPSWKLDHPEAKPVIRELNFKRPADWGLIFDTYFGPGGFDSTYIRPSKTSSPTFTFDASNVLAKPDGNGTFDRSPYQYHVRITGKARVPANLQRTVRDKDLAQVDTVIHSRVPGSFVRFESGASGPLPLQIKGYYTPDVPWYGYLSEHATPGEWPELGQQYIYPRTFKLGHTTDHLNSAVFGPSLSTDPSTADNAARQNNQLFVSIGMFSAPGSTGSSQHTGKTVLSLDGKVIYEDDTEAGAMGYLDVPPEKHRYQLHAEGNHDTVTSQVIADWSFTSEFVPGGPYDFKAIPLLAVRFAPKLDEYNRAPAGHKLTVPITVQRNAGGNVTDVKNLAVQVSYDEGKTWKPVPLLRTWTGWMVTLSHPKGAKNVSFKAQTSDGDTDVSQTIIRAYDLK